MHVYLATSYRSHPAGREDAHEEACLSSAAFARARIPHYCPIACFHPVAMLGNLNPDGDVWADINETFLRSASAFVIVTLAGWEESEGIRAERKIAQDCGISCWSTEMGQIPNGLSEYLGGLKRKAEWHDAATEFKRRADWEVVAPSIPDPKTAREFCEKAATLVEGDRHLDHGPREENFATIAKFWSVHLGIKISAVDVSCMMSNLKQSRYLHGRPTADHFADAIGYCAIGGELAMKGVTS